MGKSKSSKGSKKGGDKAQQKQQCKCDHPYQCDCGNRPERPSRGHKWDATTQTWGGKGHKQKGGSGQTASVATADKVTEKGNTTLKQWQKLPSKLLADLIKKHSKSLGGKGHPIYRPLGGRGDNGSSNVVGGGGKKKYRYRLIIPDNSKKGSSSEHDIVLTPTLSVSNDEQAKEEAALLGLLYLFPKLPHERTLPEPYRSTFLAALKNNERGGANGSGGNANDGKPPSKGDTSSSSTNNKKGATANTQLSANLPSFQHRNNNRNNNNPSSSSKSTSSQQQQPVLLTRAQINEAKAQHKREVQSRIRKHEAIRNANKPVEVFMSARFKKRIECLLSGNDFEEDVDLDDEEELVVFNDDDDNDVLQSYVHQRLVHEGFNTRHVTKAYREVIKKDGSNGNDGNDDQMMDKTYEEVLQYLCIHLKEHQLPIGFDPQLGQLDVVGGKKKNGKQSSDKDGKDKEKSDSGGGYDANILQFAQFFGLTPREAFAIYSSDKDNTELGDRRYVLWWNMIW